jgi:hypothetical protein
MVVVSKLREAQHVILGVDGVSRKKILPQQHVVV